MTCGMSVIAMSLAMAVADGMELDVVAYTGAGEKVAHYLTWLRKESPLIVNVGRFRPHTATYPSCRLYLLGETIVAFSANGFRQKLLAW